MERKFIKQITPELSLHQYNEIPVLKLQHSLGSAEIALQGAQLLSWQPQGTKQDVLWLSEIEPFKAGNAIRGGVPVCYPWFGPVKEPMHGYARISLWQLSDYAISAEKVRLEFSLFSSNHLIEAKLTMTFSDRCELRFTHYGAEPAQAALHTYFNIGDIESLSVEGLPTRCFNKLSGQQEDVPSPRQIGENVDCIYAIESPTLHTIVDPSLQRKIQVEQLDATDTVLWNPWHKPTGGMSEQGYKTMVCVETCKINRLLATGEQVTVSISMK